MKQVKRSHKCPEWDYLLIDETCKEFDVCTCFQGEMWNHIVSTIAAADIVNKTKPDNVQDIIDWKQKVIDSLSSKYLLKEIPYQEPELDKLPIKS